MNPQAVAEVPVSGWSDLLAFDHPFLANPALPALIANNWPINPADSTSLYGAAGKGYMDLPTYRP